MKKALDRGAGILLPISSLPSPYGIGSLGKEAYEFVDRLKEAGQRYWQVLPIGPTSFGDSPYQSFSAFAGNPYFIDFDILIHEGLLTQEEVDAYSWYDQHQGSMQNFLRKMKTGFRITPFIWRSRQTMRTKNG